MIWFDLHAFEVSSFVCIGEWYPKSVWDLSLALSFINSFKSSFASPLISFSFPVY